MNRTLFYLFLSIFLVATGNLFGQITFFTIANGDVAGLKNALIASNSDGRVDIIILAANGTYTLTAIDNTTEGANGLPVIGSDNSHMVSINGNGATIQRSTAAGTPQFRILQLGSGAHVSINNLIVNNGNVIAVFTMTEGGGGGIYNNQGTLTLDTCTFNNNGAQGAGGVDGNFDFQDGGRGYNGRGGGVYSRGGSLTATSCGFTGNLALGGTGGSYYPGGPGNGGSGGDGEGGALGSSSSTITLTTCTFTGNVGRGGQGGIGQTNGSQGLSYGGGLFSDANTTGTGCSFNDNSADYGGAVANGDFDDAFATPNTLALTKAILTGNIATFSAGGIFSFGPLTLTQCSLTSNSTRVGGTGGGLLSFAEATVTESTFDSNSASDGGGIHDALGTLTVSGSTFINNNAITGSNDLIPGGGAIRNEDTVDVTNCTFGQNSSASDGGAIINGRSSFSGNNVSLILHNCTLSGNTASGSGGGLYFAASGVPSSGALANNIFKAGAPGADIANGGTGTITSQGHNISNQSGGGFLNAAGDLTNTDPLLISDTPQDYGGPTKTIAIGVFGSSPAINHADPNYAPHRDQRGYFRTGAPDTGAFEYQGGVVGLASIVRSGNDAVISAEVVYGHSYQLERKINMTDSSWQSIGDEFIATGNDTESATALGDFSLAHAFYHITFVN